MTTDPQSAPHGSLCVSKTDSFYLLNDHRSSMVQYGPVWSSAHGGWDDFKVVASPQIISGPWLVAHVSCRHYMCLPKNTDDLRFPTRTPGHNLTPKGRHMAPPQSQSRIKSHKVDVTEAWNMWMTPKYERRSCWNTWRPNCMCPSPTMAGALGPWGLGALGPWGLWALGPCMFLTCSWPVGSDTISGYFECEHVMAQIVVSPRSSLGSWQDLGLRLRDRSAVGLASTSDRGLSVVHICTYCYLYTDDYRHMKHNSHISHITYCDILWSFKVNL